MVTSVKAEMEGDLVRSEATFYCGCRLVEKNYFDGVREGSREDVTCKEHDAIPDVFLGSESFQVRYLAAVADAKGW